MSSLLPSRSRRDRKVKTGCRTCKIRRVKCDEGRPACHRCTSTGRVCDGYGIWGAGGNQYSHRQCDQDKSVLPRPSRGMSFLRVDAEETRYYEWFKDRTAKKIPGIFLLSFWDPLLFQASVTEPAVLHAVLTLSSVHKRELPQDCIHRSNDPPDEQEQFMLQHYSKAINYLQPHFSAKDRSSVRVALITCVIFICLEFLRGNFTTAQIHLQNGLTILKAMQNSSALKDDEVVFSKHSRESIDDWLVEAFSRLHVQVALFQQHYVHPYLVLQDFEPGPSAYIFRTFNDAWRQMERLLNKILFLARRVRRECASTSNGSGYTSAALEDRRIIQQELKQWQATYEVSRKEFQNQQDEGFVFLLLSTYQAMAIIMADACMTPNDESRFDSSTEQFLAIINHSVNNWKMRKIDKVYTLPFRNTNMSRSIVDIGWIPPLYYTALKCRIHRLRLHAVRLLETTSHREGIWDARIAAAIARKVMEIEERNFYQGFEMIDAFPLGTCPEVRDLSSPSILPQSYRIRDVKVVLSNSPTDHVSLFYTQKQSTGDWKVLEKEYHVRMQRWIDRPQTYSQNNTFHSGL